MERKWKVGTEFEVKGKTFRVCEIADEPNTGLATVVESGHAFMPRFTMPFDIIDVLYTHHVKFQPPHCHDCPIGGDDQEGGPTCHNFDACQLECEREYPEA